jgi:monoamine oxidase
MSANSTQSASVVIIGSGVSGLYAAQQLKKKGVNDIILLEAQNYVG